MRPTTVWLCCFALLATAGAPALGQEPERRQEGPKPYASAWELIRGEHDGNGDGKVSKTEYDRGPDRFTRLDRDGDGFLTEGDFTSQARGGQGRRSGAAAMRGPVLGRLLGARDALARGALVTWFAAVDGDGDGFVVEAELRGRVPVRLGSMAIRTLDGNDDGRLTLLELQGAFDAADGDGDGKLAGAELRGSAAAGTGRTARDEAATRGARAPAVGELAPDFKLKLKDGKTTVTLSAQRGKKPVALIFGSYT